METCPVLVRTVKEKLKVPSFVVGIGGGSGSGKTTLARALAERFRGSGVCLMDQDSYYLDRSHLNEKQRRSLNYDEPSALDHNLILCHLQTLRMGKAVEKPYYDFHTHTRNSGFQLVQPGTLIILEGLYAFWDPRVAALMGLKVYVDAEPAVRFIRRLRRDVVDRGRSMESTIAQYLETVRPMQKFFIEPTKLLADLVVNTSESFARPTAELIRAVSERRALARGRAGIRAEGGKERAARQGANSIGSPWGTSKRSNVNSRG
jgi:uridine kinase